MPERFSTSTIRHSTPTSTPGITHALTTAARASIVRRAPRRRAASTSTATASPRPSCRETEAATKTRVTAAIW
jgi:hypothetical protein